MQSLHPRELLEKHRLFSALPPHTLDALARNAQILRLQAGDVLHSPEPACFAVARGTLQDGERLIEAGETLSTEQASHAFALTPAIVLQLPLSDLPAEALPPPPSHPSAPSSLLGDALLIEWVGVALGAVPILLVAPWIDEGLMHRDRAWDEVMSAGLLLTLGLLGVAFAVRQWVLQPMCARISRQLAEHAFSTALDGASRGSRFVAPAHWRLQRGLTSLRLFEERGPYVLHDALLAPTYIVFVAILHWQFALASTAATGFAVLGWWAWSRRQRPAESRARRSHHALLHHRLAYGNTPWLPPLSLARARLQSTARHAQNRAIRQRMRLGTFVPLARTAQLLFGLCLGAHWVHQDSMSVGVALSCCALVDGIVAAGARTLGHLHWFVAQRAQRTPAGLTRPWRGHVRLHQVNASYPAADHPVLTAIDLELQPGAVVSLGGDSGSGKTTLTRLLCGQLQPESGWLQLDGQTLSRTGWQRHVACISALPYILPGSLRDNIALYHPATCQAVLEWAARVAELDVESLPQGWDTLLGPHGVHLYSEWRLRVAVARALVRHPSVLIFDDALDALPVPLAQRLLSGVQRVSPHLAVLVLGQRTAPLTSFAHVGMLRGGSIRWEARV